MGTNDNGDSINGKAITYREDLKDNEWNYIFYTNKDDSKRTLDLRYTGSGSWRNSYIHADDINK